MERFPNSFRLLAENSGSRTIRSAPAIVRISSGEKRKRSVALGMKLVGMDIASGQNRSGRSRGRSVHRGTVENCCVSFGDWPQKSLGEKSHPEHHHDQRNHARPFAYVEIG